MIPKENRISRLFPTVFGAFLGLALMKFGNPAVLEGSVEKPDSLLEWILSPWPAKLGVGLLVLVTALGIFSLRWRINAPAWLIMLPLIWLGWQCAAATQSLDKELSYAALLHFTAGVTCFYLGFFALSKNNATLPFFFCLLAGFLIIVAVGWHQRLGGLEETRRYFFAYLYPEMSAIPPEYLKRIASNRIFSTLFYPNALAGILLLLLPLSIATISQLTPRMTFGARCFLAGLVGVGSLACLAWSGSKAGWLLMVLLAVVSLLRLNLHRSFKAGLIALLLITGLAGFGLRYAGYFQKGAGSAAARLDYWQAAIKTAKNHPVFGTGPATFAIPYAKIKKPESEMARLVHNDYLEQASDSGLIGFLTYSLFMTAALVVGLKRVWASEGWFDFSIWLGLFGWGLQGLTEFGLYIPALSWTAFALIGWLLAGGMSSTPSPETPNLAPGYENTLSKRT